VFGHQQVIIAAVQNSITSGGFFCFYLFIYFIFPILWCRWCDNHHKMLWPVLPIKKMKVRKITYSIFLYFLLPTGTKDIIWLFKIKIGWLKTPKNTKFLSFWKKKLWIKDSHPFGIHLSLCWLVSCVCVCVCVCL